MPAERIEFHEQDRETLREVGTLLDQLGAAYDADDPAQLSAVLSTPRLSYLGAFAAGLADRPPTA
jgi:hypothetical protein